ncbi:serine protease [Pseudomonas umsongensis]|uniref:Trypsin n=1 Tax=Pseudomonas migulae TaxID=78543 RepID=A0A1H5FG97_9PSED|nr:MULTISPECIES: serine protease [Pseudomonas]MBU0520764.1 serine protease [Gammaproteobacteria bacterium]SEB87516.1 Trypsin [Pseudomonas marginalis]MBU0844534.1 serine protease [Gammaproteobacteria bacterium]MBU1840180.1 serine protease [Gammaproteobacteria bacterium]QFG27851.1 serine protease [Pseudomonas umsongensis]
MIARKVIVFIMLLMVCKGASAGEYEPQSVVDYLIHGGHMAKPDGNQWQVALVESGRTHLDGIFCSGTLINNKWVLTAAHCLMDPLDCEKPRAGWFWVLYGSTDLVVSAKLVAPKNTVINPNYRCKPSRDDIALIELEEPVSDVGYVILADALTESKLIAPEQALLISGWGKTAIGNPVSRYLMEAEIKVVKNSLCEKAVGLSDKLPSNVICAGGGGKDSCKGDSGGPLYVRGGSKITQVGVVSFGRGCGEGPGVYTGVSAYMDWISKIAVTSVSSRCTAKDIRELRC